VVARDDGGRGRERVALAEQRVRGRDHRLRHEEPVVHVAEVEEAGHDPGRRRGGADEHVVIVGVAVDDASPQARERGHDLGLVACQRPRHEGPACRVAHVVERAPDPAGAGEVPLEVAVGLGVLEAEERLIQLGEEPAEPAEQFGRARAGLGQRRPEQPREHPREPRRAVRARDERHEVAAQRRDDAGKGQVRRALREVPQRPALQVHEPLFARRVHRLQDEDAVVGGGDAEVVVELAGERLNLGLEPVKPSDEESGVRLGQGVGRAALGQHGRILAPNPGVAEVAKGPPGATAASVLS
jgi:hypothetical protein